MKRRLIWLIGVSSLQHSLLGIRAGVTLNPHTPVELIFDVFLELCDSGTAI